MPLLRDKVQDAELVNACLNGDQSAWAELIRSYKRLIYSVARVLCADPGDADEVFQQVCLELYQRLADLRDVSSLPKWLVIVTRRQSISFLRGRKETTSLDESRLPGKFRIETIEHRHAIERALQRLPDRCRRLLDALYFSEDRVSYENIARRMKMPVASVGPTRARCLEKLRAIMSAA